MIILNRKNLQFRDSKTDDVWIGVMKAWACPSEPHGGGWGGLRRSLCLRKQVTDWTSQLKLLSNDTFITVLEMLTP